MAKASQLEKVLCRHTRQRFCGHQELVDSFKRLHSLIERLSQHLSRQELEGILVNMNAQRSVEPLPSAIPVAVAQPPSAIPVAVAQPPSAVTQRPTDDD